MKTGILESPSLPNRNAIINGAMDIWQRGTATLTNPVTGTYFPDRFSLIHVLGDGTYNLQQSVETPAAGFPFKYSLKVDCTHIETSVAAEDNVRIRYVVEGYDFKRFEGETATLSFWVKAVKTGIYCCAFTNDGTTKSYAHEYTINAANTWERKTVTLTFNSGATFAYTAGLGVAITWAIMCGSLRQTTIANKDTWLDGNIHVTDAQVNGLDSTDNNFWLTGVQLELGSIATPFEFRPFAQELALCQRYCYEAAMQTNGGEMYIGAARTGTFSVAVLFYPTMRNVPTVTYNNLAYFDIKSLGGTGYAISAITFTGIGTSRTNIEITHANTSLASGIVVFFEAVGFTPGSILVISEL